MRDDSMANGGVAESLLACATADVMLYEDTSKQWIRPDDPSTANSGAPNAQKLSNVQLIQDNSAKAVGFRIVAVRICDRKLLINQNIFPKLKYQAATTSFHQWRNEHRQVYGLSFSSEQDAGKFFSVVQQAMEYGSSQASNDYHHHAHIPQQQQHYSTANINGDNGGNSVYQEPHYYQQQQQSSGNHYSDGDQESLGSNNGHTHTQQPMSSSSSAQQQTYRKSSYQVGPTVQPQTQHPHMHHQPVGAAATSHLNSLVNANIQRRASQGSNNSSNSSQPGQNIYASANMAGNAHGYPLLQHQHSVGHAQAPPPAPPPPPAQGQALPPISSNAPPPPPPPPGGLKALNGAKTTNFADQLKQTQLRKVSNGAGNGQATASLNRTSSSSGDTGIGSGSNSTISSKTSTISSTNSGHSDLLSELAATINRRKNANGNGESKEAGVVTASSSSTHCNGTEGGPEKKVNGENNNVLRPWQKTSNAAIAANASSSTANNAAVDSPRVHRKVPSGSSLSSQEEATNAGASSANKGIPSSAASTVNGSNSPSALATLADLERLKTELVTEFQRELQKSKQDILAALRQEFQQLYQQNR